MRLVDFLRDKFADGIDYEDATCLCMALYCSSELSHKIELTEDPTMENIANAFADISKLGLIKNYESYKGVEYGANYHDINDKGHWVEVQASILKRGKDYDFEQMARIIS